MLVAVIMSLDEEKAPEAAPPAGEPGAKDDAPAGEPAEAKDPSSDDKAEDDKAENESKSARARWPALESNPEAFSSFITKLGIAPTIGLHDVFGFEPDLLMMIPQPIYAIVFLFPHSKRKKLKLASGAAAANVGVDGSWAPVSFRSLCVYGQNSDHKHTENGTTPVVNKGKQLLVHVAVRESGPGPIFSFMNTSS